MDGAQCEIRGERRGHSHRRTSGPGTSTEPGHHLWPRRKPSASPDPGLVQTHLVATVRRQGHTAPVSACSVGVELTASPCLSRLGPRPFAPPDKELMPPFQAEKQDGGARPHKAMMEVPPGQHPEALGELQRGASRLGPTAGSLPGKHKSSWRPHEQLAEGRPRRRPSRGESGTEKPSA